MIAAVTDTHATIWYLTDDSRLSTAARSMIKTARVSGDYIAVWAIGIVKMIYLIEKLRLPASVHSLFIQVLADHQHVLIEAPATAHLSGYLSSISRTDVPDMPDRIIAATALQFGVPVISRDRRIRAANLVSIW